MVNVYSKPCSFFSGHELLDGSRRESEQRSAGDAGVAGSQRGSAQMSEGEAGLAGSPRIGEEGSSDDAIVTVSRRSRIVGFFGAFYRRREHSRSAEVSAEDAVVAESPWGCEESEVNDSEL